MRLILSLLVLLLVPGCFKATETANQRKTVANVAGQPIYLDAFERQLNRRMVQSSDGLPTNRDAHVQRGVLLEDLIDRKLLLLEAEKKKVVVGMGEVEASYSRLRNKWDETEFGQTMAALDMTHRELKRDLREQLTIRRYLGDYVFSRVVVSDKEIADYVELHPQIRRAPEQVRAFQIAVLDENLAKQISREIRRGMAFEDAAIKYSERPEGKSGGDLGFFIRGEMPLAFEEVCFSLRAGEMSQVVKIGESYHLFKVVERRPESERPWLEVNEEVEAILRREKEAKAQLAHVAELRRKAKIEILEEVLAQAH